MSTDVVFVDTLHLSANIGPDCWGKTRPQPVEVSVYLHLTPSFLNAPGASDDVLDSVHYGHLSKAISSKIAGYAFTGVEKLVEAVNVEAAALAGPAVEEVRVVVNLPKQVLLAEGFLVDTMTSMKDKTTSRNVKIQNLVLPVLIGVNPPEREAKQRVITNIVFHERPGMSADPRPLVDYPAVVTEIVKVRQLCTTCYQGFLYLRIGWKGIDASAYLTLEKFVMKIVRTACLASEEIESVTVRSQKPSALSFANTSGVEITRRRIDFLQ
ncbi:hypothetical protein DXG01_008547 [Tephrocybe rancida]|nr:hypothetical protein DXG01_008547 [Tephrocybe rancida]